MELELLQVVTVLLQLSDRDFEDTLEVALDEAHDSTSLESKVLNWSVIKIFFFLRCYKCVHSLRNMLHSIPLSLKMIHTRYYKPGF